VLGATGSIGLSTLDVIARHPQRYRVFALTAFSRIAELRVLCQAHRPRYAVVADEAQARLLREQLASDGLDTRVLAGEGGLSEVAAHPDVAVVMAAIVGAAGLRPTLAAVQAGKRVLLANKEALVMSGALFMQSLRDSGAVLLPIDSEHNAIFQCLPVDYARGLCEVGVRRVLLTASGGPFREMPIEQLQHVSPEQACAHPNWSMGRKISVDSASMMNKGLELIEAFHLFPLRPDQLEVIVHPQSVVHSMVDYVDGSVLAQMGSPDMRVPIAYALAWPARMATPVARLDLAAIGRLDFEAPDEQRFPALRLAREALVAAGARPAVLNAANEAAVAAFLSGRIGFLDISAVVEQVLNRYDPPAPTDLEGVTAVDVEARRFAEAEMMVRA
jgi:1-deoxy-D-xylulose-5-phosphate reductoisomerase